MGSKGSWSCMTGFVVGRFYSLKYGLLDGFLTYDMVTYQLNFYLNPEVQKD